MSRIRIFTGHFGSGKTEIAINYAIRLADKGKKVAKNLDPVETEYGIFHYHGDYMQRGNLFDTSGWLPENLGEIYPSSFTKYK